MTVSIWKSRVSSPGFFTRGDVLLTPCYTVRHEAGKNPTRIQSLRWTRFPRLRQDGVNWSSHGDISILSHLNSSSFHYYSHLTISLPNFTKSTLPCSKLDHSIFRLTSYLVKFNFLVTNNVDFRINSASRAVTWFCVVCKSLVLTLAVKELI